MCQHLCHFLELAASKKVKWRFMKKYVDYPSLTQPILSNVAIRTGRPLHERRKN
jgi:hypothetical protein